MDTGSCVFSFTPIIGLINDLIQFSKNLDLSEINPTY